EGKTALWLADYVGSFLTAGGGGTYFFHYIASGGRGGTAFLSIDQDNRVTNYSPQYLAAQVISKEWVQPGDRPHKGYRATSDMKDADGNVLVTAYAVERPDGLWSVMLVNKDHDQDHPVSISFAGDAATPRTFSGTVARVVFGPAEYQWHPDPVPGNAPP